MERYSCSSRHAHSEAISSAQKVAAGIGLAALPWDQRSRCHASLYGAYLLFGLEG
jgi:hypothetical protein